MKRHTIKTMSSAELKKHILTLMNECSAIELILSQKGQHVASVQMGDACSGLHKTLSVWNVQLEWK